MERLFVYLIAILVGIVMLGSWAAIGFLVTRLVSSGIKPDLEVARSVGRRLSSILNLPQGYNFKDPKRFGCIPEEEGMTPPQQRRKSVTVSSSDIVKQIELNLHDQIIQINTDKYMNISYGWIENTSDC